MNCHGLKLATVSGDGAKLPMLTRHISSPATSWLTLKSGVHEVVISGYWMGPDIEDGWGYVEAVVYRTFWLLMKMCNILFLSQDIKFWILVPRMYLMVFGGNGFNWINLRGVSSSSIEPSSKLYTYTLLSFIWAHGTVISGYWHLIMSRALLGSLSLLQQFECRTIFSAKFVKETQVHEPGLDEQLGFSFSRENNLFCKKLIWQVEVKSTYLKL